MKTIPILFTFDSKFEMPAGVAITSLLENAAPETFYDIFILHGPQCDFSHSPLMALPGKYGNCRITCRKVEGEFVGSYEVRGIPETAYYRMLAPELIPEYGKILYSDVDVIFREDLGRYYEKDLGDNCFGGVDNCSSLRPSMRKYIGKELGLDWKKGYFYSGNLIINSELILREGLTAKFRELGKNNYLQQDMDIINIACNGRFMEMGPSFCLTTFLYSLCMEKTGEMERLYGKEEVAHALSSGIVHYNGPKPWNTPCLNADIWWDYYRRSFFFDEKFCHDFWKAQSERLLRLSFTKRIKLLLRYPLDKKNLK
ncbi:MAG: hypothetical protein IKP46_00430 [Bacteroidales bacterium]|nr:hypothetical protein [Bacteroidales bacterium]